MIAVVLGTQKFQLNRLLREMDALIENGVVTEEVFAQIGHSDYRPKHFEYKKFMDRTEFEALLQKSDMVITHSGVGSIITAISFGKPVIVYPRLRRYGEHVDDHQLEIADAFAKKNLVLSCGEGEDLGRLIGQARTHSFDAYRSSTNRIVSVIRDYIAPPKKKVLIVNNVPFRKGGMSSVIMNYYEQLDHARFQIDFVVNEELDADFCGRMKAHGARVYLLHRSRSPLRYMWKLYCILKRGRYEVLHVHGNSATMLIDVSPAIPAGIKNRIVHCHNTKCDHPRMNRMLKGLFARSYTKALACSEAAGTWLYPHGDFEVLPNGIELERYAYSETVRASKRLELGMEDACVVGHVGFFNEQKNHRQLFAIFREFINRNPKARLLCVTGDEETPAWAQEAMDALGIAESVTVLHRRTDVNELLQAMDVFVFPSRWEGFPVSLVEAQAAGLPCVVSDRCTADIDLLGCMRFLPLEADVRQWADAVAQSLGQSLDRAQCGRKLSGGEYDIRQCAKRLGRLYADGKD